MNQRLLRNPQLAPQAWLNWGSAVYYRVCVRVRVRTCKRACVIEGVDVCDLPACVCVLLLEASVCVSLSTVCVCLCVCVCASGFRCQQHNVKHKEYTDTHAHRHMPEPSSQQLLFTLRVVSPCQEK